MKPLHASDINILKQKITGNIYLPSDEPFLREVFAFNTCIKHAPDLVIAAQNEQDILYAVQFARRHDLPFAVQATGHGFIENVQSGLLISTRLMDHVTINPEKAIATISAGAKWKAVVAAAAQHGLAPITGSSMDIGAIGYLLGGGVGPLARSHGFSSDYLEEATVVTPCGELITASNSSHPELFWALRGGKVGFGIVTKVRLRLVSIPTLYAGALIYEEKHLGTFLHLWNEWTKQENLIATTSLAIVNYPDLPAIPAQFRGKRLFTFRFAYPGDIEEGIKLIAPFRVMAPVYFDAVRPLPIQDIGLIHNDPSHPMAFWASGTLLKSMDQDLVAKLLSYIGQCETCPFQAVEIRHIGKATTCDVKEASAVGGRSAEFVLSLVGKNPEQNGQQFTKAAKSFLDEILPWICEEGNINLMGNAIAGDHFKHMWPPAISNKLEIVKQRYR